MRSVLKQAVLHVNSSSPESTSPTMRIARFAADELKCPLVCNVDTANELLKVDEIDVLFVKYGMLKFSDHREQAMKIYERARYIVNLENDYTMIPDKRFRKADEVWSTVDGRTRYVNWNMLTRHPIEAWQEQQPLPVPVDGGLFYYGAHREGRVPSFEKYFRDAPYPVTVSSFRGGPKFKEYGCDTISALRSPDEQGNWPLTIYIEDEDSHSLYCSPATRFYECVMAGVAQVVDKAAVNTLTKAGVRVRDEWIVDSQKDVADALKRRQKIQLDQRLCWFKDYGAILREQFHAAYKRSFK